MSGEALVKDGIGVWIGQRVGQEEDEARRAVGLMGMIADRIATAPFSL